MFTILLINALLLTKAHLTTESHCNFHQSPCCPNYGDILTSIKENVDMLFQNLKTLTEACAYPKPLGSDYKVLEKFGHKWRRFWWWSGQKTWPKDETDVLGKPFGDCRSDSPYCFGRLPRNLQEDQTSLLAIDGKGNIFRWDFDHSIPAAHAAWRAFRDHRMTMHKEVLNKKAWNPEVLEGKRGKASIDQDSFMYREQFGVKSVLLDDDNCDCYSTLSMGSGMCGAAHNTKWGGPAGVFGVDTLDDPHCQGPKPKNMLELYFNEN